jgi:hypothetical protein
METESGHRSGFRPLPFSQDLLWLSLALFVLVTVAFLMSVDTMDYWWYLRVGQETLANRAVPTTDTLSFTVAGQPFVLFPWLSAVFLWLAYHLGGMTLTVFLRGAVVATTFIILWRIMRRKGTGSFLAAGLVLLAGLASSNNWSVRPQMFAYPLFALTLWVLYRWRENDTRPIWLLPAISLVWVNLHASFVLMFVLAGAALLFGRGARKQLGQALVLALLATLLNPRGFGAWAFVAHSLTAPSSQGFSLEWSPPSNLGWQLNLFFGWLLVFAALAGRSPRRLEFIDWVWFLGFGWLALSGLRYVIWFELMLAVWTGELISGWPHRAPARMRLAVPAMNFIIAGALFLLPLSVLPGIRERWMPAAPPALAPYTPVQATDWLKQHPELPGQMWSEAALASYTAFALPERPVWIDTRFEVAYPIQMWEEYVKIVEARPGWQDIITRYDINLMMTTTGTHPYLIAALRASPDWCEVYHDDATLIFARTQNGTCPIH